MIITKQNYYSYSPCGFSYLGDNPLITTHISNINQFIKNGLCSEFIYQIGEIRGASSIDCYNKHINVLKAQLPFVYLTGIRAFHNKNYELDYNGNLHIDIDFKQDISTIGLELLKEKLSIDKYIKLMFISPSGRGLKILVTTNDLNPENYFTNLALFAKYLEDTYNLNSKYIDKITYKHVCFLSYDPNCYYNLKSLDFQVPETTFEPEPISFTTHKDLGISAERKGEIINLIAKSSLLVYKDVI